MGTGIGFLVFPFSGKYPVRITAFIMFVKADGHILVAVIGMGMIAGLCSLYFDVSAGIVMVSIRMMLTGALLVIGF